MTRCTLRRGTLSVLGLAALFACSGNGPSEPADQVPAITIGGVQDGASYTGPVTITILVEPGDFTARLNGELFESGGTVSEPGAYELTVTAHNGRETARDTVGFEIEEPVFGSSDVLIVRLLDLREGTFGAPGDAILITDSSAAGQFHALIDAGGRTVAGVLNEGYVRTRLQALGVDTLRFMQLTHAHADHYIGMDEILNSAIHVRSFVHTGQGRPSGNSYEAILTAANANADTVTGLNAIRTLELGGGTIPTTVTMVPPHPDFVAQNMSDGSDINNGSIGTLVEHGAFSMYFTGDGELAANTRWRLTYAALTGGIDILKVGHHGANDATDLAWLNHSSFDVAAISANGVSHPLQGALDRIRSVSTTVYCTNVHGEIRITVDEGGVYTVSLEKNAGSPCVKGSAATT